MHYLSGRISNSVFCMVKRSRRAELMTKTACLKLDWAATKVSLTL